MSSVPLTPVESVDGWRRAWKTVTYDGGTANDPGDQSGTGNPQTLFTVTGAVRVKMVAYCTTLLAGATATLEIGTTTNTAGIIAQTTATNIDANEIWHDATPDASVEAFSVATENIVIENIEGLVGTADITAGVIVYVCLWEPISPNGNLVAA